MRATTTTQETALRDAVLAGEAISHRLRVEVLGPGSVWYDLSNLLGLDFVQGARLTEHVDAPHATAECTLRRSYEKLSIAPLMSASRLNNLAGSYQPLLALSREWKLKVDLYPLDTPTAAVTRTLFHGRIDRLEWGGDGNSVQLAGRDLGGRLTTTWLRHERIYGYAQPAADSGCRTWEPSTVYAVGERVVPTSASSVVRTFRCTTGGTSGSTEPAWATSGTTTSNTAVFTVDAAAPSKATGTPLETLLQAMLNDALRGAAFSVALQTPVSPGWALRAWLQQRGATLEVVKGLAAQIGWDVRFKYQPGTDSFAATLYEPQRTKTVADATLTADAYDALTEASTEVTDIRNIVRVPYFDHTVKDASGNPTLRAVEVEDAASRSQHGDCFMELGQGTSSNIDSNTEALKLANAALSDLAQPPLTHRARMQFNLWAELGDLYAFAGNAATHDTTQKLAVVGYTHQFSEGQGSTEMELRGKPSGPYSYWLDNATFPGTVDGTMSAPVSVAAALSLAAAPVVGGANITVAYDSDRTSPITGVELHVSATTGFTPSDTTLVGKGPQRVFEVSKLTPGATYYARAVPYVEQEDGVTRGQPGVQSTFVAGYATPAAMQPQVWFGALPPNADFEAWNDAAQPPDGWTLSGTLVWGTHVSVSSTANSGTRAVTFPISTGVAGALTSQRFTVRPTRRYILTGCAKISATVPPDVDLVFYNAAGVEITYSTLSWYGASPGAYTEKSRVAEAPATAAFAAVRIRKDFNTDGVCLFDSVSVEAGSFALETAKVVGLVAGDQTGPPWQNGWGAFGGGFGAPSFYKDAAGIVHLSGLCVGGTMGAAMFTLPSGYRPKAILLFGATTSSSSAPPRVDVDSNGEVRPISGSNGWFSLDGISFRPDEVPAGAPPAPPASTITKSGDASGMYEPIQANPPNPSTVTTNTVTIGGVNLTSCTWSKISGDTFTVNAGTASASFSISIPRPVNHSSNTRSAVYRATGNNGLTVDVNVTATYMWDYEI